MAVLLCPPPVLKCPSLRVQMILMYPGRIKITCSNVIRTCGVSVTIRGKGILEAHALTTRVLSDRHEVRERTRTVYTQHFLFE